jgi:hypothetical protein
MIEFINYIATGAIMIASCAYFDRGRWPAIFYEMECSYVTTVKYLLIWPYVIYRGYFK